MKVLYCMDCFSIHSPDPSPNKVRFCDCGQASVRWINPTGGQLEVRAQRLDKVRVIGLNNQMLLAAHHADGDPIVTGDWKWKELHELTSKNAQGYLFHEERRNCWAVIIGQHESGDITWLAG